VKRTGEGKGKEGMGGGKGQGKRGGEEKGSYWYFFFPTSSLEHREHTGVW